MAEEIPRIMKNQANKRQSSNLKDQSSSEQKKRVKRSGSMPPPSNVWVCGNRACRATQPTTPSFCKRCSCCICCRFDDNKDPSLWLECTPDSGSKGSCGFSCHVECALHNGKVGVNTAQLQLDGSYCCASCGELSSIIGFWKKQLKIAIDAHRIDVLCCRIFLSYRLLNGTSRYKELHKPIEDLKAHLEIELGPLNDTAAKMSRGHANRLHAASHVQTLCKLAIQNAEEHLTSNSTSLAILNVTDVEPESLPLERLPLPDLNKDLDQPDTTNRSPLINDNGSGCLGDDFEDIMKTIRGLEQGGLISKEFRLKFFTWFSLRSREQERRVVATFVKTMSDDPAGLAGQLVHSFSDVIFSTRP